MKDNKTNDFYEFASYRLDVKNRRLRRGDKTVSLTPKEFDLLLVLVENAGQAVGKNELLEKIWKDTFVEEGTLTRNISWLRKKLAANGDHDIQFIETLPKRGYCFLPEVIKKNKIEENDAFVIEEETFQHFHIEEKIEIVPSALNGGNGLVREEFFDAENRLNAPQASNLLPAPTTKQRYFYIWFASGILITTAICFGIYRTYFYNSEPKTIPVKKVSPFSGLPGRETMPAFSPDGKIIAFTWDGEQGDNIDVYVKLIGAGEPVRLTDNRADDIRPTFSPDGKTIAFVRALLTHNEVFIISALGGAERKICDLQRGFSNISFSPDGRFLAAHHGDNDGRAGIFLINIETGEKNRLTAPPELANDDQPAFSPDGQVAFVRSFAQNVQEIFIHSASGGEPRQLTFDKARLGGIAWSADGKRIVFVSRRKYNGRANLWQINASGGGEPELIATGSDKLGNLAVSPDRRTIAFVEESFDTNIWRIEPSRMPERDAFGKFAPSSFSDNSPNVSPDGSRVVFASSRTGKYEIWIADINGSNARQLTDLQNFPAGSPRFSPDGKWIVFDAQIEGNGDIFIVPADGGALRRVTDSPAFDYMPAWSADGNWIYFASTRSGKAQIYKIPVNGGETKQITRNGGNESYASPDGKHLYYRKGEGSAALWRVSTEGDDEQIVPELADGGYWRYWTLTKTGIYFVPRSEYPPYKIMFYEFLNNRAREIAAIDASPISVYPGLGASDDGKTILYSQNDQNSSSIMLAEIGD